MGRRWRRPKQKTAGVDLNPRSAQRLGPPRARGISLSLIILGLVIGAGIGLVLIR